MEHEAVRAVIENCAVIADRDESLAVESEEEGYVGRIVDIIVYVVVTYNSRESVISYSECKSESLVAYGHGERMLALTEYIDDLRGDYPYDDVTSLDSSLDDVEVEDRTVLRYYRHYSVIVDGSADIERM